MITGTRFLLSSLLLLSVACSGGAGDDDGTMGAAADGGDDANSCAPTPSRLIVLGDSIAACFGVGDKDAATCGPKIFHDSLASDHAPGLVYENLAVSGAVTTDVAGRQLATVPTGVAGHAIVLIYVGGNDLQAHLTKADAQAQIGYETDLPGILADWQSIFAFFNDSSNFPDGATIIMNNQYNPFDDCTAAPYNFMSPAKIGLLGEYNTELATLADTQSNVHITDQHAPYLGHGHHYAAQTCPHFAADSEPFMQDLIHPNAAGHAHLATQWTAMADGLYGDCE